MCGLVGVAGALKLQDEALMKRLLVLDYFRGTDSTGFAVLRNNKDSMIVKMASHPFDLFDSVNFQKALQYATSSVFLGHNRAATLGKVNGVNAHPFESGDIVGAHNGTLVYSNWGDLEDNIGEKTGTDSEAIIKHISYFGIEETVKVLEEGLTAQNGAWALTWFDKSDNTINFIRNKHRPLWYAYDRLGERIIWASEWEMIQAATGLSSSDYELYEDDEGFSFFPFAEDTWYKFSIEGLKAHDITKTGKPVKPFVKKLKGKEPKKAVSYSGGAAPFHSHTTTSTTTSTTSGQAGSSTVIELFGDRSAPFAGAITRERFAHISKYGCSWCGADVHYEDTGVTVMDYEEVVLCPSCSGKEDNRVYLPSYKMDNVREVG